MILFSLPCFEITHLHIKTEPLRFNILVYDSVQTSRFRKSTSIIVSWLALDFNLQYWISI